MLNAIVHRDYSTGVPIQVKVFPDEVIIYNQGRLPENWTVADLLAKHSSVPHNPGIANAFFRSGQIETWGRGIEKIEEACAAEGRPAPVFAVTGTEIRVSFSTDSPEVLADTASQQVSQQVAERRTKLLARAAGGDATRAELMSAIGLSNDWRNAKRHLEPMLVAGLLELTDPEHLRSSVQRYRLTEIGRDYLTRTGT